MSLVVLIVFILLLGLAAGFINQAPVINANMKWLANAVLFVIALVLVLEYFGVMPSSHYGTPNRRW